MRSPAMRRSGWPEGFARGLLERFTFLQGHRQPKDPTIAVRSPWYSFIFVVRVAWIHIDEGFFWRRNALMFYRILTQNWLKMAKKTPRKSGDLFLNFLDLRGVTVARNIKTRLTKMLKGNMMNLWYMCFCRIRVTFPKFPSLSESESLWLQNI